MAVLVAVRSSGNEKGKKHTTINSSSRSLSKTCPTRIHTCDVRASKENMGDRIKGEEAASEESSGNEALERDFIADDIGENIGSPNSDECHNAA